MKGNIKIEKIMEQIYRIEELDYKEHCNCFFIIGKKKSLLVDLGVGLINFQPILEKHSKNKELIVVLTHFHFDHFGGAGQFRQIWANKQNLEKKDKGLAYLKRCDFLFNSFTKLQNPSFKLDKDKFHQLKDSQTIDLGGIVFKVIFTPGHDPTSLCLYEPNKKIILTGDLIYNGKLIYDLTDSNKKDYLTSLQQIQKLKPKIILGGHNNSITERAEEFIQTSIEQFTSS